MGKPEVINTVAIMAVLSAFAIAVALALVACQAREQDQGNDGESSGGCAKRVLW